MHTVHNTVYSELYSLHCCAIYTVQCTLYIVAHIHYTVTTLANSVYSIASLTLVVVCEVIKLFQIGNGNKLANLRVEWAKGVNWGYNITI